PTGSVDPATGLANDGSGNDPSVQLVTNQAVAARMLVFIGSEVDQENAQAQSVYMSAATSWLQNAQWHQDNNQAFTLPKPVPALEKHVVVTRDAGGNITGITVTQGPDTVAAPVPDIPPKAVTPANNVLIGAQLTPAVF